MRRTLLVSLLGGIASISAAQTVSPPIVHPGLWPTAHSPVPKDPAIEARISALLESMSIEEKVGQTLQPEMKSITPADVVAYHIGSSETAAAHLAGALASLGVLPTFRGVRFREAGLSSAAEAGRWRWFGS